jgi:hypothetical protein
VLARVLAQGRRSVAVLASAAALAVPLAACGSEPDPDAVGDQVCELGIQALGAGLQEFSRTRAVGDFLSAAAKPGSVPCRNAIANLARGRPATFDLLRPDGTVSTFEVPASVLQPGAPTGGSAVDRRREACAATYASTFLLTPCLDGRIDPL